MTNNSTQIAVRDYQNIDLPSSLKLRPGSNLTSSDILCDVFNWYQCNLPWYPAKVSIPTFYDFNLPAEDEETEDPIKDG